MSCQMQYQNHVQSLNVNLPKYSTPRDGHWTNQITVKLSINNINKYSPDLKCAISRICMHYFILLTFWYLNHKQDHRKIMHSCYRWFNAMPIHLHTCHSVQISEGGCHPGDPVFDSLYIHFNNRLETITKRGIYILLSYSCFWWKLI